MENMQITGAVRQVMRRGGSAVLVITAPRILGDTPAAEHARATATALLQFAKEHLVPPAEAALIAAAREGRLFSFSPHVLTVSLSCEARRGGIRLLLAVTLIREGVTRHVTRTSYWQGECLRRKWLPPAKRRAKARKNA